MSKSRKHQDTQRGAPTATAQPQATVIGPTGASRPSGPVFSRHILWQLLAIAGLSSVLGFTFNAANPVGIRFNPEAAPAPATIAVAPTLPIPPTPPVPLSATASAPAATPQPTNAVGSAPAPVVNPVAAPTPWSVSAISDVPNSAPPPAPTAVAVPTAILAPPAAPMNPAPIHWPEAKAIVAAGGGVLVDVRHRSMYDAGHIPGAISLPEMTSPDEFRMALNQHATNVMLIVYCSSTSCSQSSRVANRLVHEFQRPAVRYMTGGYAEYQQAELTKPAIQNVP